MRGVGCALALALLAAPAGAARLCVNPGGTRGCLASVQDAVTAAGAGDTVLIQPGVYYEPVIVPPGKDGLRILGANRLTTVLDPDVPGGSAPGLYVLSNSVRISNLTIRNGLFPGIDVWADGATVQGVRIMGVRGVGEPSLRFAAGTADHRILGNEIRGGTTGIELTDCSDSIVRANVVAQVVTAVDATGAGLAISANRLSGTKDGIVVVGDGASLVGNVVQQADGHGLSVTGDNFSVSGNALNNSGDISVQCASCASSSLVANRVTGSREANSIYAHATGPGLRLDRNQVSGAVGPFGIFGQGVIATSNVVTDSGLLDCFEVHGSGHTLTGNRAARCGRSGFYLAGDGLTLDTNVATAAGVSGFVVDGDGGTYADATLTRNRAVSSNGQGFAVVRGAVHTVLTSNTALRHRVDFCDEGSGTDATGGNTFGSASLTCDVVE